MAAPFSTSIELRHLRYFVFAADHGSFRKAGVALEVKESSISRSVRDLEDEIGVSLFIRHSSGVNLTLAGQRFLNRTRQALYQIREATVEAAALGRSEEGHLKIGLFSNLSSGFLRDLFQTYDSRYAGIHIDFVEAPAENHAAAIRRFDLDAAFVLGRQSWPDCDAIYAWSEPLLFALPRLHSLVQKDVLSWRDLVDETFLVRTEGSGNEVRGFLERKFRELDISPRISTQQVARYRLLGLVATGRGIVPVLESETACGDFIGLMTGAVEFEVGDGPRRSAYGLTRHLDDETEQSACPRIILKDFVALRVKFSASDLNESDVVGPALQSELT